MSLILYIGTQLLNNNNHLTFEVHQIIVKNFLTENCDCCHCYFIGLGMLGT